MPVTKIYTPMTKGFNRFLRRKIKLVLLYSLLFTSLSYVMSNLQYNKKTGDFTVFSDLFIFI